MTTHTKRSLISALILWHLFNLFVDGFPSICMLQDNLQYHLGRYMNAIGQWQGSLAFFSPSPDSLNLHLEAELDFTDGTHAHWRSINWKHLSILQKFVNNRLIKYIDNARRDDNRVVWEPMANWIARQFEVNGRKVKHIELSRHWVDIPPPPSKVFNSLVDLPHTKSFVFYRKDFI